ncbi:MAG: winged helix-turn-helix transcriptional regulator [Salibacteraceae bacterium]
MKKTITPKVQHADCPVTFCMQHIGGKWKPILIHLIRKGANRFGILERGIEGITKQMLTKQLRELEADGILTRTIFPEIPPRVEYGFTDLGRGLFPVIAAMSAWGLTNMSEKPKVAG